VRQDLKKQLAIPLILTTIFIVSSFIPIIQFSILTFDGGLISLVNKVVGAEDTRNIISANVISNLLPTAVLLLAFFKTIKRSIEIITATLSMILMTAFIFFITDGITKDSEPYYLDFLIIALISGSILTLVAILKYKKLRNDRI
jgi:hypothetical protein